MQTLRGPGAVKIKECLYSDRYVVTKTRSRDDQITLCEGKNALTGSAVTIKVFHNARIRFANECSIMGVIPNDQPNLVHCLTDVTDPAVTAEQALVFESFTSDLESILDERDCLSWSEVRHIIKSIAVGLKALHNANIAHRGVKLESIVTSVRDFSTENILCATFKLFSFEQAFFRSGYQASCNQPVGTSLHSSPEVYAYDGKCSLLPSDVWALGVVMFNLATSLSPWSSAQEETDPIFKTYSSSKATYWAWVEMHSENPPSDSFKNLFEKMCDVNPATRLAIPDVLNHPFFANN